LRMNHSRTHDEVLLVIEMWIGVYKDVGCDDVGRIATSFSIAFL
jgi:hypothetical protein